MNIQWFPGHMAKTRRLIAESCGLADAVCEVVDARIPQASRNPELSALVGDKPRMIALNRMDQADAQAGLVWAEYFRAQGFTTVETDSKSGAGVKEFVPALRALLRDKIARNIERGQAGRPLRVMVVGIPNVGKSTLINRLLGRRAAVAEDRPGVTRSRQWYRLDQGLELLDTPGVLWPKFEDEQTGLLLAFTGAIRDDILDAETLAARLMALLARRYPDALAARYRLTLPLEADGGDILVKAAKNRGFLISGGKADTERMARTLLDEYRSGRIGRFTLETPGDAP